MLARARRWPVPPRCVAQTSPALSSLEPRRMPAPGRPAAAAAAGRGRVTGMAPGRPMVTIPQDGSRGVVHGCPGWPPRDGSGPNRSPSAPRYSGCSPSGAGSPAPPTRQFSPAGTRWSARTSPRTATQFRCVTVNSSWPPSQQPGPRSCGSCPDNYWLLYVRSLGRKWYAASWSEVRRRPVGGTAPCMRPAGAVPATPTADAPRHRMAPEAPSGGSRVLGFDGKPCGALRACQGPPRVLLVKAPGRIRRRFSRSSQSRTRGHTA